MSLSPCSDIEFGGTGTGAGQFTQIRDVAIHPVTSAVYVLDLQSSSACRVQIFDSEGGYQSQFSIAAPTEPVGRMTVGYDGAVYLSRPASNRLEAYHGGALVWSAPSQTTLLCIQYKDGVEQLIAADADFTQIEVWSPLGAIVARHASVSNVPGASDMVSDPLGRLYVLGGSVIRVFAPDASSLLDTVGSGAGLADNQEDRGDNPYLTFARAPDGALWYIGESTYLFRQPITRDKVLRRAGSFGYLDPWGRKSDPDVTNSLRGVLLRATPAGRIWVTSPVQHDFFHDADSRYYAVARPRLFRLRQDFLDSPDQTIVSPILTASYGLSVTVPTDHYQNIVTGKTAVTITPTVTMGTCRLNGSAVTLKLKALDMRGATVASWSIGFTVVNGTSFSHSFTWTPPLFGAYAFVAEVVASGVQAASGVAFLVCVPASTLPSLSAGQASDTVNALPQSAWCGLKFARLDCDSTLSASVNSLDALIDQALSYGMTIMVQFNGANQVAPSLLTPIVNRYKSRVSRWSIINEPTNTGGIADTPAKYLSYLRPAHDAIKAADPSAKICGPNMVNMEPSWIQGYVDNGVPNQGFIDLGGLAYVDEFTVHWYDGNNGLDQRYIVRKMNGLRATLAAHGYTGRLWQNEWGATMVDHGFVLPALHAGRAIAMPFIAQFLGIPNEQCLYYYQAEHGYGDIPFYIFSSYGTYATAAVFRQLYTEIGSRTYTANLDFGATGNQMMIGLRYTGGDGTGLLAILTDCDSIPLRFAVTGASTFTVADHFGNTKVVTADGTGHITVIAGALPVYIRIPSGSTVVPQPIAYGTNQAVGATFTYTGAHVGFGNLTNGILEAPQSCLLEGTDPYGSTQTNNLPYQSIPVTGHMWEGNLTHSGEVLEVTFPSAQSISKFVLWSAKADNGFCGLFTFKAEALVAGTWQRIAYVNRAYGPTRFAPSVNAFGISFHGPESIWAREFAPVTATKVRFTFYRASYGGYADKEARSRFLDLGERRVLLPELGIYA